MAAKLLHSLSDDNQDLQRQIGCMTGIFQLFDRQQIISGRRIGGLSPKRFPSGSSHVYSGNFEAESNSIYHRPTAKEKIYENRRVSLESSRPSFSSSSRSSSFSSLDCNIKINQVVDPSPYDRIIFPETPSRDPTMNHQPSASPQYARSSLDLRDVVKDSIYRDTWGLSVKTTTKEEQLLKSSSRQTLPEDLKESIRVLAKIREAPWYCDESGEYSRSSFESKNGSVFSSVSKDAPRFSYDGRETIRSNPKHKELPRLSLDSREGSGSIRSVDSDSKSSAFFRNSYRENGNSENKASSGPSVVAKLMGLETLSDAKDSIKSFPSDNADDFSRSLTPIMRPFLNSSMSSWKEPNSPRRKNSAFVMKPVSSSRVPIEPAPWKQLDGARGSQKQVKTPTKPTNSSFPSVYSEVEKRLKDLEFTQSGKDLRALKQILEAMQAKGLLDNTKREGLDSKISARSVNKQNPYSDSVQSSRAYKSPIVIMKPAKLVSKSGIPSSSVIPMDRLSGLQMNNRKSLANNRASKGHVSRTSVRENGVNVCRNDDKRTSHRTLKSVQSSVRSQNISKENATSPRLQKKKLELERRSRPPISPDSNKTRRQTIKNQQPESSSPGGKRRLKTVKMQQNDNNDQSSEVSSETTKTSSYQEEDTEEVSSSERQRFVPKLREEGELSEFSSVAPEQPSPVSVLDETMYADDALSPVKRMPAVLKDEATTVSDNPYREEQKMAEELVSNTTISRKKLENIENLVQKLRRVNSTHDEAHTDYIASLCENTNPDHRYISEILLASGLLLRDLSSSLSMFQLHPSGYPINPELFLVLEQTKASTIRKEISGYDKVLRVKCDEEKFRRKLIFDTVNEILAKKLTQMGTRNKMVRRSLNAQKLLRDLCSEIENLQKKRCDFVLEDEDDSLKSILWEDVMNRSDNWTDINSDLSGLVLDVERLIFKDLVSEIIHGEAARTKTGRRCRQLFA